MGRAIFLVLILASGSAGKLAADQVTLTNGDRLTGTIEQLADGQLRLKSELAGEVTLPWTAVESLTVSQPLYVTVGDEPVILGTLTTTAAGLEIRPREGETHTVTKEAVRALRSRAAEAAYQVELERLEHPRWLDVWGGSIDAGLSAARGNADTFSTSLGVKTARTTARDTLSLFFTSLFAENTTAGATVRTANTLRGGARYDVNLSPRLFTFGFTELEFDEFQQLDLRVVLGGGLGWQARRSERTRLQFVAGGSSNQEFFSTGVTRKSGEAVLGQNLNYRLSSWVSLSERLTAFPNLSETGEYRVAFDASIITKLSNWLSWNITLSDRYLSNPLPGNRQNDALLTTGISFTFGTQELRGPRPRTLPSTSLGASERLAGPRP